MIDWPGTMIRRRTKMICDVTRRAFLKRSAMAAGATAAMPGALRAELPGRMQLMGRACERNGELS